MGVEGPSVILRTAEEIDTWTTAPVLEALALRRPLPDYALMVVLRGEKKDIGGAGRLEEPVPPPQRVLF